MNTRVFSLLLVGALCAGVPVTVAADDISGQDPEVFCERHLATTNEREYAHCSAGDLIRPSLQDLTRVCNVGRGIVTVNGDSETVLCVFRGSVREVRGHTAAPAIVEQSEQQQWQRYNDLKKEFFAQQKRAGHRALANY